MDQNKPVTTIDIFDRLVYAIHHEVNYYSQFSNSEPVIKEDAEKVRETLKDSELLLNVFLNLKAIIKVEHGLYGGLKVSLRNENFILPMKEEVADKIEELFGV